MPALWWLEHERRRLAKAGDLAGAALVSAEMLEGVGDEIDRLHDEIQKAERHYHDGVEDGRVEGHAEGRAEVMEEMRVATDDNERQALHRLSSNLGEW